MQELTVCYEIVKNLKKYIPKIRKYLIILGLRFNLYEKAG